MIAVVRTCACAFSFDHLDFRLSMLGSHTRNQDEIHFLFQDRNSPSYFSRELFKFGAYANSLEVLDCSHCVLYNEVFLFQKAKFSATKWRQLLEIVLMLFLLTIWISDCVCFARICKIRMNSLSVFFWDRNSPSNFWGSYLNLELMRICFIIWIVVMVYWQYFRIKSLFQKANFSPINEERCKNLSLC